METHNMGSSVGSNPGPRDTVIQGKRVSRSPNSHVSAQDEHPNPTLPQPNSMLLGQRQPLRGAQERFYLRTETDTAHALRQHMRLDHNSMPARPSTIWVNPPETKEGQAGKEYVILPEMILPVADVQCNQNSKMRFSAAVSKSVRAKMISGVRLDASRWQRACRYMNQPESENYQIRSQRQMYEQKLRNWTSKERPYRRPTLTTVGPTGFIADWPQNESRGDDQMATIQFPEAIVDKVDLHWGDRGRLMVEWPIARELLANATLWLGTQHSILSDINAMTTPLETNANNEKLPIDIVRYFIAQDKWIWITKMERSVHDVVGIDKYVIDFRETEFANTARMMYFQKGQTSYLHHFYDPERRDLEDVEEPDDLFSRIYDKRKSRGALDVPQHDRGVRVPGSLFEGVVDNLNLRGKLKSLVQKSQEAARSEYDSPPNSREKFNSLVQKSQQAVQPGHDSPSSLRGKLKSLVQKFQQVARSEDDPQPHRDLLFVDMFIGNEKMPKAIPEVLAEVVHEIKLIDFAWLPKIPGQPDCGPLSPASIFLESPKSLEEERRLKAKEESEEVQWVPDDRGNYLYLRDDPELESWYPERMKDYPGWIARKGDSESSSPFPYWTCLGWKCIVEAACPECYYRFRKAINSGHNPPPDIFAPHCSYGANKIQEWERQEELRCHRGYWFKYPNNSPVPRTQSRTVAFIKRAGSPFLALAAEVQHLMPGRRFGHPPLQNPIEVSSSNAVTHSAPAGAASPALQSPAQPSNSNSVTPSALVGISPSSGDISPSSSADGVLESAAVAGGSTPEEPVNVNPTDIPPPLDEDVQTDDSNPRSEENINTADLESANDRPREDSGYASNFDPPAPSNTGRSPEHAVASSLDMGRSA